MAFPTTHWSAIVSARDGQGESLEQLCREYWPPVYAFLRQRNPPHDAKDLAQGFFEFILSRNFLDQVEREGGRFRSFLLAALRHYVSNVYRQSRAQKRGGGRWVVRLDEVDGEGQRLLDPPDPGLSPAEAFDREWARTVFANAAARLRAEEARRGHGGLLEVLEPVLFGDGDPGTYQQIGARFGMSVGAVKQRAQRLRERLRYLIRECVERTVRDPEDVEDELRHLTCLLARG